MRSPFSRTGRSCSAGLSALSACGRPRQEHSETISAACNYANTLLKLERFAEAKSLLHEAVPVARRVLGNSHDLALKMRNVHARALYLNPGATLADLREAVKTLEETERTARRVLGGAHPLTEAVEFRLREARAALSARETPSPPPGDA